MSNIELAQKVEYIPALYYRITDVGVSEAIETFDLAEIHLNMDAERRALLVLNIEAKSQKLKHYQAAPNTPYTLELKRYMEVYIGFRFDKYEGFETLLNAQIISVLKLVGDMFPSLGRLEIFGAIKYAIKHKPEIVKPYDTKDTISSFTAVYLSQIVRAYIDYKNIAAVAIKDLVQQLPEKKNVKMSNLEKIKSYRMSCLMAFRNANYFLHENRFEFDSMAVIGGKTYLNWLYENMQVVGLILTSNKEKHPYQAIWDKWKNIDGYDIPQKIAFSKKEIIESVFKQIPSEMVETETEWVQKYDMLQFAKDLGFFQEPPEMNLEIEMSILEILEKYGKGIVNIYPLQQHEVEIRSNKNTGIFSQLKEYLNSFHVEHK